MGTNGNGKLPYFPFYPKDFLSDDNVMAMSALQCGAYIRLLCIAWNSHPIGTLIASPSALAKWAMLSDQEWEENKALVMAPFTLIDGRWHQKRMVADGISLGKKHEIFKKSGLEGANKRWNREAMATPSKQDSLPNGHPIAYKNQNTIPPPSPKGDDEVEIPLLLRTPKFVEAWRDLVKDRKERKKKMTKRSQELTLEKCLGMGETRAIETIRHSIASGYQGLYEQPQSGKPRAAETVRTNKGILSV